MFVSLKPFGRYKHALIATGAARDTPEESAAWINLADARRVAFLTAGLPAWIAALAGGTKFIMNGANHKISGISTYPFQIFGNGWEKVTPEPGDLPYKGDTVVGNDVWMGYDVLVMPGVTIGDGAIISSRSVVVGDVPAYSVVGGNPAKVLKHRFPAEVSERLLTIAWWDWPIEKITRNLQVIVSGDIEALEAAV